MDSTNINIIRIISMFVFGMAFPLIYFGLSFLTLKRSPTWVSWLLIITTFLQLSLTVVSIAINPTLHSSFDTAAYEQYTKIMIPLRIVGIILNLAFVVGLGGLILSIPSKNKIKLNDLKETFS